MSHFLPLGKCPTTEITALSPVYKVQRGFSLPYQELHPPVSLSLELCGKVRVAQQDTTFLSPI